jgi:hypothetical protein
VCGYNQAALGGLAASIVELLIEAIGHVLQDAHMIDYLIVAVAGRRPFAA